MNDVRPGDSQQNEGVKCFFPKTNASISCIQWELPILHCPSRKEIGFLPRMKFVPLICNKTKGWNVFFPKPKHQYRVSQWVQPICLCLSQKETRFLPRTKFVPLIPNKTKGWNVFFSKLNHQYCVSQWELPIYHVSLKRNYILVMNEVHPVDSQQNEGLKCFFLKTKAAISCIPMGANHFSMSVMKSNLILAMNEVHPVDSQ